MSFRTMHELASLGKAQAVLHLTHNNMRMAVVMSS